MDYFLCKCLYHSGVKGMKWGVRRYQDENGNLIAEGKKRYLSTGGKFLIDILSQVQKSDLPIETKIMKNKGYYFEGTIEE